MDALLYFLFWAVLIFVMLRFGCGAHVMGHGRARSGHGAAAGNGDVRWIAPETDTDPVCGMVVETENAKSAVHDGAVYYFCSSKCRETFEASPQAYTAPAADQGVKAMEHVHD